MIYRQDRCYPDPDTLVHTHAGVAPPRSLRLEGEKYITHMTEAVLDSCEISMQVYPNTASDAVRMIRRMQEQEREPAQDSGQKMGTV